MIGTAHRHDGLANIFVLTKRFLLAMSCLLVSACSLLPTVPQATEAQVIAKSLGTSTAVDLPKAKQLLSGWHVIYTEAAATRRNWQLGLGEGLFYGSVFAVVGAMTHHRHLRNTAIAVAGGSSLLDGHYQLNTQQIAFRKAITKLACMEEATLQITPEDEMQFVDITQEQAKVLVDLPSLLVNKIAKVRTELGDTLNGIQLSTPSKEDIGKVFSSYLVAKAKAPEPTLGTNETALAGFSDPARLRTLEQRRARYVAALEKVNPEIEVCMTGSGS